MRAVENFPITGYKIHEGLIRAFAIVKKAAALANTDVGRLELNKGGAIAEAAQEILDGKWHDHFIVDPIQGGRHGRVHRDVQALGRRSDPVRDAGLRLQQRGI